MVTIQPKLDNDVDDSNSSFSVNSGSDSDEVNDFITHIVTVDMMLEQGLQMPAFLIIKRVLEDHIAAMLLVVTLNMLLGLYEYGLNGGFGPFPSPLFWRHTILSILQCSRWQLNYQSAINNNNNIHRLPSNRSCVERNSPIKALLNSKES